jgi:hypothetical protein
VSTSTYRYRPHPTTEPWHIQNSGSLICKAPSSCHQVHIQTGAIRANLPQLTTSTNNSPQSIRSVSTAIRSPCGLNITYPQLTNTSDIVHRSTAARAPSSQGQSLGSSTSMEKMSSPSSGYRDDSASSLRTLPSRNVTDSNFDDAYVDFIMYCNPSIPSGTNSNYLRGVFRSPPKNYGKMFSTWLLFELVSKLEKGTIKTWAALMLELGVEPPDIDAGQSAQRIQQYAVRLKVVPNQLLSFIH